MSGTFFFVMTLISGEYGNASCRDALWKIANGLKGLAGGQVMQENVPLGRQLLAKRRIDDHEIAFRWVAREVESGGIIQQIVRSAPPPRIVGTDLRVVDDVYDDMAKFILTIPEWKTFTNERLRALVQIDRVLSWVEKQIPGTRIPPWSKLRHSDRDEWNRLFPTRPLPDALELLHIFQPG